MSTLRENLGSKEEQIAFDQRMAIADRQFDGRMYRHIAEETSAYRGVVFEGVQAVERRNAAQLWDQPGQIELSLLRIEKSIDEKARQDGLDPTREGDRQVIHTLKTVARSQVYSDVIDTMLVQGKDKAAVAFYKGVKDSLTPESLVTLGNKIEAASVDGESMRATDTVWEMLGPKSPNDPVRLDVMEQAIRNQYRDDPRTARAAINELRSRVAAHNDTQRELRDSNKAAVLGAYHDGADLKKLQTMPEYQALDGEDRNVVRDYVINRGHSLQQQQRAEAEYQDGVKSRLGFQRYWELSNPKVLSGMSEAQIMALEPELGRNLTGDLLTARRKLGGATQIHAATIDSELFNVVAAEAGLDPYNAKSPEAKEKLGRLRNRVETVIDLAQQQQGRTLTREEKEKLMRSEVDRKVMVDEWGRDPKLPAATIKPEQREKVYVPIKEIEPKWMKEAINYMRSTGAVPLEWNDTKVKEKFGDRLERAYAWSITGGAPAEGRKILEGR